MNVAIAFSDDTISINNVNYKLEDVEGNYIIRRQMLKLLYAFAGLFLLLEFIYLSSMSLFLYLSIPIVETNLVLLLMIYPYFLIGKKIMRKYYFPELVLTTNGIVVLRMIEWPKYKTTVATIRSRVKNIRINYYVDPTSGTSYRP